MATVQINYKSGKTHVVKADKFKVTRAGGEITNLEWEGVKPNPLYIGINDIESVWEL